jgi:mannose-6-phosphate isomerase
MDWHPLRFQPIYKDRVWGGCNLAEIYGRSLPPGPPIGESWEITDRPEGVSVVSQGPLAGRTLAELMSTDPRGLLGNAADRRGRFPLLVKILDAREVLSLQVHPPAAIAARLGGESKTEMWYFTGATADGEILAGLRQGVTRADFERSISNQSVADCFHRIRVRPGDAMFLPSGRVHALGAGLLLFEIQENSDTTYRVFDWNRQGLDGKPRPLHIAESLASIDFTDKEPSLITAPWIHQGPLENRSLVDDPVFRVEAWRAPVAGRHPLRLSRCVILGIVEGALSVRTSSGEWRLRQGDFCLLPAALGRVECEVDGPAEWLTASPGAVSNTRTI